LLIRKSRIASIIVGERAHAARDGDHQPSLTTDNVIAKGLDAPL
jgi:hypothetical protein